MKESFDDYIKQPKHRATAERATAATQQAEAESKPAEPEAFPWRHAGEVEPMLETFDFVEDLLTIGGLSVVLAPPGSYKSFFALDLAAHVATGTPYTQRQLQVEQGAVLYITLEGGRGFANRIAATKQADILPADAPLYWADVSLNLLDSRDREKLEHTIKEIIDKHQIQFQLIILDTLARAMPGGDENSGKDMGAIIAAFDAAKASSGAHGLLVHHPGKDITKGGRGWSGLFGALDTQLSLSKGDNDVVTVTVTKQKDLRIIEPYAFSVETVVLGTDPRRGKDVTSLVLHHEPDMMAVTTPTTIDTRFKAEKPEPTEQAIIEALKAEPMPTTHKKNWSETAYTNIGCSVRQLKKVMGDMIATGKLYEGEVRSPSGQRQVHISINPIESK